MVGTVETQAVVVGRSEGEIRTRSNRKLEKPYFPTFDFESMHNHINFVDALLIARLAAQPLFGGSRRLGLDLIRLAVRARCQRHLRHEYHCHQSNRSWHDR